MRTLGLVLAFLLLAGWLVTVALHHETWRDEADAWLIARDNDIPSLIERIPYTGHFAPWYLALMAMERLGASRFAPQALALVAVLSALALLLFTAPFPPWSRLLIAISFPLAYQYAIVARPYCLLTLAFVGALAIRPSRFRRPRTYAAALVALAVTVSPGTLLAVGLMAASLPDLRLEKWRRAVWGTLGYSALGPLLAAAQAMPPEDGPAPFVHLLTTPAGRAATLFGGMGMPASLLTDARLATTGAILNGIALVAAIWLVWPARPARWFLLTALGGLLALHLGLYIGGVWHAGVVFLAGIGGFWIAAEGPRDREPDLRPGRRLALVPVLTVLIGSAFLQFATGMLELRAPYSVAAEAGARLREAGLECRPIAAFRDGIAMSVLPHLPPRQFWYVATNADGTHTRWDRRLILGSQSSESTLLERFEKRRTRGEGALLLFSRPLTAEALRRYRLVLRVAPPVPSRWLRFGRPEETYWVYQALDEPDVPAPSTGRQEDCGRWQRPVPAS